MVAHTSGMGTVIRFNQRPSRRNTNLVRAGVWSVMLTTITGLYWINTRPAQDQSAFLEPLSATFSECKTAKRTNCIVDGDTFWFEGQKIRIADINTPEVSEPSCSAEARRGETAKRRLLDLMNAGQFSLAVAGPDDKDRYGRKLRVVMREGRSIGDTLIAEGLARRWGDASPTWCE
jgi:micrococcal nuclease